jgi:CRP-like cAMP-binding protein
LYVVKSGKVDIRLGDRLLDTLPDLSIFGEMSLIDHSPRSATAVAATDATVVPVGEKQFLFLVIAPYLSAKSSHRGESWLAMRTYPASERCAHSAATLRPQDAHLL